ncbi:MAG: PhnD/SsuA/transferrin family substrate-binding protein [Solirubrobacterales bacterium]|nr:PhnD/SsuA/transferrin family substrate-binding protein [Solirubrobacterales bacterium]
MSVGRKWPLPALLVCLLTVGALAGCGGDEGEGAEPAANQAADEEPVSVTMAYLGTASDAAMVLGNEKGFFEEAGIDLQLEQVGAGGSAVVPAVLKGQYDVASGGIDGPILAAAKGLPMRILGADGAPVSKGHTYPEGSETGTSAIVVPKDSEIETLADIKGAKLAAITVTGLQYLCIAGALEKQGLEPEGVEILEIPPPEMLSAMDAGRVDAAALVEPFLTLAKKQGGRVISFPCEEAIPGAIQAGFFTSAQWAEENPDVAQRLSEALVRSNQYAEEHPDELREVIPEYTEITPELARDIILSRYDTEGESTLDVIAAALLETELIEETPDLDPLLVGDG